MSESKHKLTADNYNRENYTDPFYSDASDRGEICPVCHGAECAKGVSEIVKLTGHAEAYNEDLVLFWCPCGTVWSPYNHGNDAEDRWASPALVFEVLGYAEDYKPEGRG